MGEGIDYTPYRERARKLICSGLSRPAHAAAVVGVVSALTDRAEVDLVEGLEPSEGRRIACRAGCGSCCVVNVAVLFPEALAIAFHLQRRLPPPGRERIKARLDDLHGAIRWLDDEERIALRRSCAFLDHRGNCGIYPVRPLLCRSVTSTDPEACREAVAMMALGETRPVLMNLFQQELMNAYFLGAANALEELGLDGRGLNLTGAVKHLLDRPRLVEEFLAGERLAVT
jgi:Fe-S-cluster containining protein